ncbi:MAG TPA: Hpt domain-containing protein [Thermodesulfobacteriota bacterium]
MGIDREAVIRTYLAEADGQLGQIEEGLRALEARPDDAGRLETICRAVHTLKGTSAMLEFHRVAEFARAVEEVLERLGAGTLGARDGLVPLLLSAVDALREFVPEAAAGVREFRPEHEALLRRLAAVGAEETPGPT